MTRVSTVTLLMSGLIPWYSPPGRSIRVRHFRDGKELPPLAVDDYYDFNFQQILRLQEERTILPSDHITTGKAFNGIRELSYKRIRLKIFSVKINCIFFRWFLPFHFQNAPSTAAAARTLPSPATARGTRCARPSCSTTRAGVSSSAPPPPTTMSWKRSWEYRNCKSKECSLEYNLGITYFLQKHEYNFFACVCRI